MTAELEPEWSDTEVPRDGWGRPLVMLPDQSKRTAYTRATTYVGCLEDQFGLGKWQKRKVAEGLASRPDLLLRVNSLGGEPDKYTDEAGHKRWRTAMDQACEDAIEAAKAHAAATIGTALHALTERMDRGQDVGVVPDQYRGHLDNYARATSKFTALHIEQFVVQDQLKIGGTPDRIITIDGLPGAYIADLKTGSTEYGVGKMAMQLAVYSRSQLYDPATGARSPYATEVNQQRGLIIGLNAGTGAVELFWVDLEAGWTAVQLATQVRAWRARKDLTSPWDLEPLVVTQAPTSSASATSTGAVASLEVAIDQATSPEDLIRLWREADQVGAWNAALTARATSRKAELSRDVA